ncbi:MAG: hypothetical protein ACPG4K_03970 [Haloferula sp.]
MNTDRPIGLLGRLCSLMAIWPLAALPSASAFNALAPYEFESAGDREGWSSNNANLGVAGGSLSGTVTAPDPQVFRSGPSFAGSASSGVLVRYRGSKDGPVQLFWARSGSNFFSATRVVTVSYSGSGDWQTLFLSPNGHDQWDGQVITQLRLDPAGTTGDTFEMEWLRVLAWDYDNDGRPDELEGTVDSDGDGLMDMEDLDSDNNGLSDAWERQIRNAPGSVHFDFETDLDPEGWAAGGGLSVTGPALGRLSGEVTGADPELSRGRLHLMGGLIEGLIVRLESPAAGSLTLFWSHDGDESFAAERSATVPVPAGSLSAYFDLGSASEWNGELITGLRIDPDFPQGTVFSIDSIRTSDGDFDQDGLIDSAEGWTDPDGDGLANLEDPDSDGDGVSDSEEARRGWQVLDPVEATLDSDGDGVSDADESTAGTDPMRADDRPETQFQKNGSGFELSMTTRPGRSYALQRSSDLTSWNVDSVSPQVNDGQTLVWPVPVDSQGTREFHRVSVTAPMEGPGFGIDSSPTDEVGSSEDPFLDNGTLRLGAPTRQGASFDFLAPSGGGNLVNLHDQGRLIQQSYYAGATLDRVSDGQSSSWSPWPWNPIQGGDASNNQGLVQEVTVSGFGKGFYSRTIPLLWDMTTGEQAKAYMDQWNEFEPGMPNVVRVTCRLICFRDPADVWGEARVRNQELPAVYLIRDLSKVVSYFGASPWTGDTTEAFDYSPDPAKAPFPWAQVTPTEPWMAMVDPGTDIGVGLYSPVGNIHWNVGSVGGPAGGPTSSATMHMAPLRNMKLDRDSIMVYRYWLIYGDLSTIRSRVYELHGLYPGG